MKRKIQRLGMTEGNYAACVKGLKVQTRRRMKEQPPPETHRMDSEPFGLFGAYERSGIRIPGIYKPRYAPGEFVALTLPHWRWVGFGTLHIWDQVTGLERMQSEGVVATHALPPNVAFKRKAARYMPAWAALHFAEIVGVRAERVQEISAADCRREGLVCPQCDNCGVHQFGPEPMDAELCICEELKEAYADEWEMLHGEGAWERNDWVWVYDYKLCPKPEGKP